MDFLGNLKDAAEDKLEDVSDFVQEKVADIKDKIDEIKDELDPRKLIEACTNITPLESQINFKFSQYGNLMFKVVQCCYSIDRVTEECNKRVRELFLKCTCGVGALVFPAIEGDFIVFDYRDDEIFVRISTGAAFPTFIGIEVV